MGNFPDKVPPNANLSQRIVRPWEPPLAQVKTDEEIGDQPEASANYEQTASSEESNHKKEERLDQLFPRQPLKSSERKQTEMADKLDQSANEAECASPEASNQPSQISPRIQDPSDKQSSSQDKLTEVSEASNQPLLCCSDSESSANLQNRPNKQDEDKQIPGHSSNDQSSLQPTQGPQNSSGIQGQKDGHAEVKQNGENHAAKRSLNHKRKINQPETSQQEKIQHNQLNKLPGSPPFKIAKISKTDSNSEHIMLEKSRSQTSGITSGLLQVNQSAPYQMPGVHVDNNPPGTIQRPTPVYPGQLPFRTTNSFPPGTLPTAYVQRSLFPGPLSPRSAPPGLIPPGAGSSEQGPISPSLMSPRAAYTVTASLPVVPQLCVGLRQPGPISPVPQGSIISRSQTQGAIPSGVLSQGHLFLWPLPQEAALSVPMSPGVQSLQSEVHRAHHELMGRFSRSYAACKEQDIAWINTMKSCYLSQGQTISTSNASQEITLRESLGLIRRAHEVLSVYLTQRGIREQGPSCSGIGLNERQIQEIVSSCFLQPQRAQRGQGPIINGFGGISISPDGVNIPGLSTQLRNLLQNVSTDQTPSRYFPPHAKKVLEEWYEQHNDYPYANDEELTELSGKTGVTIDKVQKWLSNKRNRTNNTKKRKPKEQNQKKNHNK